MILSSGVGAATSPVADLTAAARGGQVFLTWHEADTPEGTTFNIYASGKPIVSVTEAKRVGHHIERHSARDWREDPASFKKDATPGEPVGFITVSGGQRLYPVGEQSPFLSRHQCRPPRFRRLLG